MANFYCIADGNASAAATWSLSPEVGGVSGAPAATPPTAADTLILDSLSDPRYTVMMDLPAVHSMQIIAGNGNFHFMADVVVAADISIASGHLHIDTWSCTCQDYYTTGVGEIHVALAGNLTILRHCEIAGTPPSGEIDGTVTLGTAGQVSNVKIVSNRSRCDVTPIAGATYNVTGKLYIDRMKLANGTYTITWPSDSVYKLWIAPTFDNCAEALWDLAAPINGLTIQVTQQLLDECTELVHTFGNAKLKAQNNITIPAVAALHTNGDWVEVYAAGSVRTITVDGTLDCRNLTIGRASSIASGGQLKGSGSVFVRGDFSLEASEASATVNNTLDLSSFQRFFVGGYFAIAGDRATILPSLTHLDLEVQGSVYGWAVSLFADFTNVTLLLIGSTFAELDYGDDIANDIHTHFTDITIRKELTGNVRAIWGQTYSGHYIGDAIGTTLMTWGAGQVFTFASMTHLQTDQYAITHVSDSAGVAANIVVGETGTQGNGANWLDISFNIPVYMNPGTCTDGGGNTNIFFSDIPIEGSSRNSLSLSLSLGF